MIDKKNFQASEIEKTGNLLRELSAKARNVEYGSYFDVLNEIYDLVEKNTPKPKTLDELPDMRLFDIAITMLADHIEDDISKWYTFEGVFSECDFLDEAQTIMIWNDAVDSNKSISNALNDCVDFFRTCN